jgi:hypothetical protein
MNVLNPIWREKNIDGTYIYGITYNSNKILTEADILHLIKYYRYIPDLIANIKNISCPVLALYIKKYPYANETLEELFNINSNFEEYIKTLDIVEYKYLWKKIPILDEKLVIKICTRDPTMISYFSDKLTKCMYEKIFFCNTYSIEYIPKKYHNQNMLEKVPIHLLKYIRHDLITEQIKLNTINKYCILRLPVEVLTQDDFVQSMHINPCYDIVQYMPIDYINEEMAIKIIHTIKPSTFVHLNEETQFKIYSIIPTFIRSNYKNNSLEKLWRTYPHLLKYIIILPTFNPYSIIFNCGYNTVKTLIDGCSTKELIEWYFIFVKKIQWIANYIYNILSKNGELIRILNDYTVPDIKQILLTIYFDCKIDFKKIHSKKCLVYHYDKIF